MNVAENNNLLNELLLLDMVTITHVDSKTVGRLVIGTGKYPELIDN